MKYFTDCKTVEAVKRRYKDLAKQLHPDCGGDAEKFKEMSAEFEIAFKLYKDIHEEARAEEAEGATEDTEDTAADWKEKIDGLMHMDGVNLEIIGSWIWATGNTYQWKEDLKNKGFRWSKSKKAWYHTGESTPPAKKYRGTCKSLNEVRAKWGGSRQIGTGARRPALAGI